jgi:hypothetical protein
MIEAVNKQYVVMFAKMGFAGPTWEPVDAHYNSLEEAEAVAARYGDWQILEIAASVIKTSKDPK